ncbi:MAG: sigma-54-dependent Fis family transcriptional regulator [Bacteroidetes bacterium]|nr:sigma-54-dependent Fis family transcriptional regulator [Bacteroidota bacterium]
MEKEYKILVVDDEPNSTKLMRKILSAGGYKAEEENNSVKAKEKITKGDYDLVISDLQMPDVSGLDLLRSKPAETYFIIVTGFGSVDSAVESMKNGAYDYLSKPFNIDEFTIKVKKALDNIKLNQRLRELKDELDTNYSFGNIIGRSRKMLNVFEMIRNVAGTDVNVLIEGQSGTGKELVSKAIHKNSKRKDNPFIAINCSAIPENLLESELFGHTKGAFTGATDTQKGVFEQANGGTLLLDEIADMPFHLQSKLLRVIENWEIKPLGSDKVKKVDVRLISATNQNIKELIQEKKFRDDLYYRISTVSIMMPSLNERKDDIPLLVDHILKKLSARYDKNYSIDADGLSELINRDWKGNVRELENILERTALTSQGNILNKKDFRFSDSVSKDINESITNISGGLKELEKIYINKVLEENKWNKLKAAQILGIDRKTLYKKIKEYDLE